VRILYLADIRFPLERANGIQSMETCHALASRGHDLTLVVRPDSHEPPRDPFVFYGTGGGRGPVQHPGTRAYKIINRAGVIERDKVKKLTVRARVGVKR